MYLGDFTPGKTVTGKFNTHKADGTPITLAGTPSLSVYKHSTTESVAGVTLTVDYDSRTGLHDFAVDTSADGTFYATGNDFDVVITAGTVDSVSVVGTKVAVFSLSNRSALRPATPDRAIVVDASGSVLLSVGTGAGQVNLSGGKVPATVAAGDIATDAITAASVKADAASKIAAAVEAAVLNEGDATPLLAAIAAKVEEFLVNEGDSTATLAAIGAAVRAALATELGRIDATITSRLAAASAPDNFATMEIIDGLVQANADQVGGVDADPTDDPLEADVVSVQSAALTAISNAVLGAGDLDGLSVQEAFLVILAVLAGKVSGAGTSTLGFSAFGGTKVRVTATVDGQGNRTGLTIDVTAGNT